MAEEERDERPRPQYGELAPPGWVWHPPQDDRLDSSRLRPAASEAAATEAADSRSATGWPPSPQRRSESRRWDLNLTILLLVIGFFGMTNSIAALHALPATMELVHMEQSLGEFTLSDSVGPLIATGVIAMAGSWAVSVGLAVWMLVHKRLAFYVPLTIGVAAVIALLAITAAILATDPALLDHFRGFAPSPAPTPTGSAPPG